VPLHTLSLMLEGFNSYLFPVAATLRTALRRVQLATNEWTYFSWQRFFDGLAYAPFPRVREFVLIVGHKRGTRITAANLAALVDACPALERLAVSWSVVVPARADVDARFLSQTRALLEAIGRGNVTVCAPNELERNMRSATWAYDGVSCIDVGDADDI
jgi:hypothetical protein